MFRIFDLLDGSRVTPAYVQTAMTHGVRAIHITINNFSRVNPLPTLRESLNELAAVRAHYDSMGDLVKVIEDGNDFDAAERDGKLGVVLGYQNVPGVARDLHLLELFYELGVRVIQIAHNVRGLYADGCAEPGNAGLSTLGEELLAEMNRLGMVVDLSHTGDQSVINAAHASEHPVVATHSNCYAVCRNVRNKSDEALRAIRDSNGVLGICYLPPIVRQGVKPTHADVAAHVLHAKEIMGLGHVALGTDFILGQPAERYKDFMKKPEVYGTWPWRYPVEDLADQQRFLNSLQDFGLSKDEIAGIASENALRVFKQVIGSKGD